MDLTLIWKTVLIGLVEGITEFLPVSSTGHIILAEEVLHFQGPPGKVFEIVIQLGAILAVCVLYRAKIFSTVTGVVRREPLAMRFAAAVIVAFLPAAIVGVAAHKYIKAMLDSPTVVAVALIVGGIAILIIERFAQRPRIKSIDDIDLKTALFIGVCQCLAMIPGVSRSGSTIMARAGFSRGPRSGCRILVLSRHPHHDRGRGLRSLQELVDARLARRRPDCAGFLHGVCFCTGRGRRLRALHQPPWLRRLRLVPHCNRRIGARPVVPALNLRKLLERWRKPRFGGVFLAFQ